jgi:hypothetical protein
VFWTTMKGWNFVEIARRTDARDGDAGHGRDGNMRSWWKVRLSEMPPKYDENLESGFFFKERQPEL